MSRLADSVCDELGQAFRRILRDAGVKGILAGHAADLIDAVEQVLARSPLSTEEVAAAIIRDGGFMRVGEASAWIDGHYVSPGALVDALMHLRRVENGSPESTETDEGYRNKTWVRFPRPEDTDVPPAFIHVCDDGLRHTQFR